MNKVQSKEERQARRSPPQKKREDYERERIVRAEYPHRHRRCYPKVKDRFQRMERHLAQGLVSRTLMNERADVSNALLQTVTRRCRGPKIEVVALGESVEWKLQKCEQTHGAKKRRQGLPVVPRSKPIS